MEIKRGYEVGKKDAHLLMLIPCPKCGRKRWIRERYNLKLCKSCFQLLDSNHNWKGGRRMELGYIWIRISRDDPFYCMTRNGYVVEHRLIMARTLGRPLVSQELVHHIDGNKTNNNLENLLLTTRSSHAIKTYKIFYNEYHEAIKRIAELESKVDELLKLNRLLLWLVKEQNIKGFANIQNE